MHKKKEHDHEHHHEHKKEKHHKHEKHDGKPMALKAKIASQGHHKGK